MAGVARRLAPPPAGSDCDLLARFADARDPGAFAALVARHGAAVHGVCRARLANAADADDAFQVVFYVLARDARRIRDRESVAGWLMRVAHLTALKVRRHHARHPAAELPADVAAAHRPDDAAAREERAIVAEELAALPDKFRAVLVLCAVEGRSNTEAAEALGCPRGTVDSRLAAAKAKLRQRLVRRGVGVAAVAGFEAALPQLGADAGGWPALADGSWLAAIQYGTGASHPTTLTLIADGVTTTMTTTTKLVATVLLAGGLLTTAGVGLTQNPGDDGPPVAAKAAPPAKADKPKPPAKPDATPKAPEATTVPAAGNEFEARERLTVPVRGVPETMSLRELVDLLRKDYGMIVRVDFAAYKRLDPLPEDLRIYEIKLKFPVTAGMTVADFLSEAVAQLPGTTSYRVRDGQILIGPGYQPAAMPNRVNEAGEAGLIEMSRIAKQILGEPVSLSIEDKPFREAIRALRRLTGANIVVDYRGTEGDGKAKLTAAFDDVPLYSALEVLGDIAGLKPVFLNNVYYLTSPENAEKLQKKVNEELFGRQQKPLAVPAGYLTDGINFYLNPGNLKPEAQGGFGGSGFSGGGGLGAGGVGVGGVGVGAGGVVPAAPTLLPGAKK